MTDKGKRVLDADDGDDSQPRPKRPRVPILESVFTEAMRVNSLQRVCSLWEPILRKMVREEIERALATLGAAMMGVGRNPPRGIQGPDGRNLQLHFRTTLFTPIFTGGKVEGENGNAIQFMLLDAKSGQPVRSGPEAFAKLNVLALDGDFNNEDDGNWTEAEFQNHIIKEREGKGPLLAGELQVSLQDGSGTLGDLSFTDNSCWTRSRKFRVGLKIASGCCEGVRIREAKTDAFVVRDRRGELYQKHYPPALEDEVWRLEKIGKGGSFQNKLHHEGINTVEDFLKCCIRDPQRLRKILGMPKKMWESLVDHAKTCTLNDRHYIYYQDEMKNTGAIFNVICEFRSLIVDGRFYSAEALGNGQKDLAAALVKNAYSNWDHAVEYEGRALLEYMKNKKSTDLEKESLEAPSNYPTYNQPVSQIHSQSSVVLHQRHPFAIPDAMEGDSMTAGYDGHQAATITNLPQNEDFKAHMLTENPLFVPQNNSVGSTYQAQFAKNDITQLGVAPIRQPSITHSFVQSVEHLGTYDHCSFQENYEEKIWNEDIPHSFFCTDGASTSLYDSGFDFSSYMPAFPDFSMDYEQSHTGAKAVVGWLKIKAAMRWGIFVRKKAAERRAAQLIELVE